MPDGYDHFERAAALAGVGRHEDAVRDYDRVVALDPRYGEDDGMPGVAWYQRGDSLTALGRYDDAVDSYDRCLALLGEAEEGLAEAVRASLAAALRAAGRHDDEVALWNRAVDAEPDNPYRHVERAFALVAAGRAVEAAALLGAQVRRGAHWSELAFVRSTILCEQGDPAGALDALLGVADRFANVARWWREYVGCLLALGRTDDAVSAVRQAVTVNPDWYDSLRVEWSPRLGGDPRWDRTFPPRRRGRQGSASIWSSAMRA